jgi:hypothetical protein
LLGLDGAFNGVAVWHRWRINKADPNIFANGTIYRQAVFDLKKV